MHAEALLLRDSAAGGRAACHLRLSAGDDGDPGSRGRAHERQDASSDCRFHGHGEDRVPGAPFEISDAELAHADAYEVAAYVCVKAPLASGVEASIYVDARDKSPSA